jgi:hypothetical protein
MVTSISEQCDPKIIHTYLILPDDSAVWCSSPDTNHFHRCQCLPCRDEPEFIVRHMASLKLLQRDD